MPDTRIAINVHTPFIQDRTDRKLLSEELTSRISAYSHDVTAFGGYDQGNLSFNATIDDCNDWLINGLGREIQTISPSGRIIWQGFVNNIDITYGSVNRTVGPLLDIGNKVKNKYVFVDPDTDIPLHGVETETAYVEDTISQGKYGIFEVTLNGGEQSHIEALQTVNSYLYQHSWPEKSRRVNLSNPSVPSIKLSLLGYYHWFSYVFNDPSTGEGNLSDKIKAIIDADPNSVLEYTATSIAANTTQVKSYEDGNKKADALLKALVMTSDNTYDRYSFGVYDDRVVYYNPIVAPDPPAYVHNPNDISGKIYDTYDNEVYPWDVLPGKWLYMTGFDIGRWFPDGASPVFSRQNTSNDMIDYMFIEKVGFSIPNRVVLDGGKVIGFDQRLSFAKGLSGAIV